jgi:hypothetical protein
MPSRAYFGLSGITSVWLSDISAGFSGALEGLIIEFYNTKRDY